LSLAQADLDQETTPESSKPTFDSDHRSRNPEIAQSFEQRLGRVTHHVVIEKASAFDNKTKRWLRKPRRLQRRVGTAASRKGIIPIAP
jgi:hypothetical protein